MTTMIPYTVHDLTFFIREGTSDQLVVNEIVLADEYRLVGGREGVVVDIGANIGAFSTMAAAYGATAVYAYEPEPDNLEVARRNIAQSGHADQISLFPLAVYSHDRGVSIEPMQGGTAVELGGSVEVPSITLDSILVKHNRVNYLKMDVEGAEIPIFGACNPELLKRVDYLAMEYHGQTPEWGDMIRMLSGVFDLEIIGHPYPGENSGGMLYGTRKADG